MKISDSSVEILSALLLKKAGHPLSRDRQYRIETALGPLLKHRQFGSVDAMAVELASRGDIVLETEVVEALLNNETYFFRDRSAFDLLDRWLREQRPPTAAGRRLRIWCAGVSTGQEAYSLAMLFDDQQQWRERPVQILGTDISATAIEKARAGLYSQFEVQRGLPTRQLIRYFEKEGADWRISAAMRARVQFENRDIMRDDRAGLLPFDIILCRNVLLYFPPEARRKIFERLHQMLAPDGVLLLGAAETILGQTDRFEPDAGYRGLYRPKVVIQPTSMEKSARLAENLQSKY